MMKLIQNLRIGTKLAITSALSIILIAGMIVAQMGGNAALRARNETADVQQTIGRHAHDAKASVRGMQISVRDIRLAYEPDYLKRASDDLTARLKSTTEITEAMQKLARDPEDRERMQRLKVTASDYAKAIQRIAVLRGEAIGIEAKRSAGNELPVETMTKLARLNDEAVRIARDEARPMAAELEALAGKIADSANHKVEEEVAAARQEMALAERNSMIVGLAAALLLIATCVFSIFTISRPMTALTGAMKELANGNFGVVLPGLGRG